MTEHKNAPPRVGIIGGEVLGLTLALYLGRAGYSVTVIEASNSKGNSVPFTLTGRLFQGESYLDISDSDTSLMDLLNDLDLASGIEWSQRKYRIYSGTQFTTIKGIFDYLLLPTLSVFSKLRLLLSLLYFFVFPESNDSKEKGVKDWLSGISGSRVYGVLWEPLLKKWFGSSSSDLSVAALYQLQRYTGLPGFGKNKKIGNIQRGENQLYRALFSKLKKLNVKILTDTWVNSYEKYNDEYTVDSNRGLFEFDALIVTSASAAVLKLCRQLSEHEKRIQRQIKYQGEVSVFLLVRGSFGGCLQTLIDDKRIPFSSFITVNESQANGTSLLYLPCIVPSDNSIFDCSDKIIAEDFIHGVMLMFSFFTQRDVIDYKVLKNRHLSAVPMPDGLDKKLTMSTSDETLFIINPSMLRYGKWSLNDSISLADSGAELVDNALKNLWDNRSS